jgi:hypothetical protein
MLGVAFLLGVAAPLSAQTIDLTAKDALSEVRLSKPEHYERIRQILVALADRPSRVQGDWLAKNFGVTGVEVGPLKPATDGPPTQSLRFRLDEVRYQWTVIRFDVHSTVVQPDQTLLP